MAGEAQIVVTGNLGNDPELKITNTGKNLVRFSVANTPSKLVNGSWENGDTMWFRCVAWEEDAASIAVHYKKGDRVRVEGSLSESFWVDKEGIEKRSLEINVDWIGQKPPRTPKMVTQNPEVVHRMDEDPLPADNFPW
jgi:single-strand DNA-binding protein